MDFDRLKDPEPKYFEEILRNSLSEDKVQQFCADFLGLFRPKKHKQPVPCAIGSADTGKTSLFAPVFQIIPLNRIARVTKQKSFNKAMIDSCTEVIFLDEAFSGLLEIDDWKILCQGGFMSHDVKWKKAEGFHCSASMYITCQTELDFGRDHNEAMDKRLHKYHFTSLPHVNPEANKWLRQHAMDSILWSQKMAGDMEDSATPEPVVPEHGLPEEDLQNILSVSLLEEDIENSQCSQTCVQAIHSISESDTELSEDSDADRIDRLRSEHAKAPEGSLRQRHLTILLTNREERQKEKKRHKTTVRNRRLASRKAMLVVDDSEASQFVIDPDEPLPTPLERKKEKALEERRKQREEKRHREEEEKIRVAFGNPWLLEMEKDMAEQIRRMEQPRDEEERRLMKSLLEVNCDKLRNYHERHGTMKLPGAVKERKRLCLNNHLVNPSCLNLIRDLCSPMPVIHQSPASEWLGTPPRSSQSTAKDEEGQVSFPTPKTPSYEPHHGRSSVCPPSPVLPFIIPAKRRHRVQSQQTCKRPKKITSYFHFQS